MEVAWKTQGKDRSILTMCLCAWEHRQPLPTATFPVALYYEHPENAHVCELYLCYCFEMSLSASRSSRHTY